MKVGGGIRPAARRPRKDEDPRKAANAAAVTAATAAGDSTMDTAQRTPPQQLEWDTQVGGNKWGGVSPVALHNETNVKMDAPLILVVSLQPLVLRALPAEREVRPSAPPRGRRCRRGCHAPPWQLHDTGVFRFVGCAREVVMSTL